MTVDRQISTETIRRLHGWDYLDIDGWPALSANTDARHLAASPDGSIYFQGATADGPIRYAVGSSYPGFTDEEFMIAAEDGSQVYRFDRNGRHLATLHALTGAVIYTIGRDSAGRLTSITDSDGNSTTIERDASGVAVAIVAPFGQRTTVTTDPDGYLASLRNPAGETTSFTYTPQGALASMTNPRGRTSQFGYDSWGWLTSDTDAAGGGVTLSGDRAKAENQTVTVTTAEGRETRYGTIRPTRDQLSFETTFPTGLKTTATLTATSAVTHPDGTIFRSGTHSDPRWRAQAPYPSFATTSTPGGLLSQLETQRTASLADSADILSLAEQTDVTTINGRQYTTMFEGATRRSTSTTPEGRTSVSEMDAVGRLVRQELPGLAPLTFTHDSQGRLVTIVQSDATSTRTTTLAYSSSGFLESITDPLSRTVSFEHDPVGRVTKQTLPGSREVLFSYDPNGNLTSLTPPGRPAHLFTYTPVDLVESYTAPDVGSGPATTSYSYNKDKQLTQILRPDGQTIVIGYDSGGRLQTVTAATGVSRYVYHTTTGHLSSVSAPSGVVLGYAWDGSLPTGTTWSGPVSGSVTRTYNNDFRTTAVSVNGSQVSLTYDNDGLLTGAGALTITRDPTNGRVTRTTLGSITTTSAHSSFGELASTTASSGSTALYSTSYARDALGRITQVDETVEGVTSSRVYEYDAAGRLWKVIEGGLLAAEYTYDQNDNRLTETNDLALTVTSTSDAQDRLLTHGTTSYTYSANGEIQTRTDGSGTTTYTYDVLGNLLAAALPDGRTLEYVIDGQNRRVGKRVNGTLVQAFLYSNQLKVVAELDPTGSVRSRFVYGARPNTPDYMVKGSATYRILADYRGSPRLVVDVATGTVAQRMDYDEWGRVLLDTNPGFQPFGFAGGLYDQDTRLVRFGARDYDSEVGRWTVKDRLLFGTGLNPYSYVEADPINWRDPFGTMKLPADPSGLGPEWQLDPSHKYLQGKRYRHPSGNTLDYHYGHPKGGKHSKGPHWHHDRDGYHYKPGDEVPDPKPACQPDTFTPSTAPDDEPEEANDDPVDGPVDLKDPERWNAWDDLYPNPMIPLPRPMFTPGTFPNPVLVRPPIFAW